MEIFVINNHYRNTVFYNIISSLIFLKLCYVLVITLFYVYEPTFKLRHSPRLLFAYSFNFRLSFVKVIDVFHCVNHILSLFIGDCYCYAAM